MMKQIAGRREKRGRALLKCRPIGVFDSGVGGLTVVEQLWKHLPYESIVYFGDTAHVPYGSREVAELISLADSITAFLVEKGCKVIIDACNTTSSVALDSLKRKYQIPVVGVVEPGAQAAARASRGGKIGVIATEATVKSEAYLRALKRENPKAEVWMEACPLLVPLIEAGETHSLRAREAVYRYLQPLLRQGIDTLVYGCTHYPYLHDLVAEIVGTGIELVDPAEATVLEVKALLAKNQALADASCCCRQEFYVSGSPEAFYRTATQLVGEGRLGPVTRADIFGPELEVGGMTLGKVRGAQSQ